MSRVLAAIAVAWCAAGLVPATARAHFLLHSPASWREQDSLGSPQKLGPCGDEIGRAATGIVTPYAPGDTVTITLDETVFHPGHYRVALAVHDRSELPAEPPVTPGATPCGSVPVVETPALPILADGVLTHVTPFAGTESIQVTLPPDVTCDHCTLQVLEFMSSHQAPCFYHHCADLSIHAATPQACSTDADCADANACTTDRCTQGACEHVMIDRSACDDGNPCTRDACAAVEGCVSVPLTLVDARPGFVGSVDMPSCATDSVPHAIATLFRQADALVARAAAKPAKARRLLARASKRLDAAATRVAKASGRRVSAACGSALAATLADATTRVACLERQGRSPTEGSFPEPRRRARRRSCPG